MDLLLSRYSDLSYIMEMEAEDGVGLLEEAVKQDIRDKLYKLYVQIYPSMDKDSYISFEEFYNKSYPNGSSNSRESTNNSKAKDKKQIMANVENIMSNYKV